MPHANDPVVQLDAALLRATRKTQGQPEEAKAIAINRESQLFADDHLIASTTSLFRRLNQPDKQPDPVLAPEKPWEGAGVTYGSAIENEDGSIRMYYKILRNRLEIAEEDHEKITGYQPFLHCMASSGDGYSFTKDPLAGACYPDTNVVLAEPYDDCNILRDDHETDPNRRYKLLSSRTNDWWGGLTPATSPDGIRWTWGQTHAVTWFGDRCSYWYDPIERKHIAWSRNYKMIGGRVIAHKETSDFDRWDSLTESHPRIVMQPDRYDSEHAQFYGGYGFWYHSLYFAYLEVYHLQWQRIDTQLCCSRDGRRWTRLCDREVFLPNGRHGAFDAYWIVPSFNAPILRDGKLLIHYSGRPDPHSQPGFGAVPGGLSGAIGLATLREDGFVSLDATGRDGALVTHLLERDPASRRFEVNLCPFKTGPDVPPLTAEIELLDEADETIVAFAIDPNRLENRIWTGIDLPASTPARFRVRMHLRNARLYAIRVC